METRRKSSKIEESRKKKQSNIKPSVIKVSTKKTSAGKFVSMKSRKL